MKRQLIISFSRHSKEQLDELTKNNELIDADTISDPALLKAMKQNNERRERGQQQREDFFLEGKPYQHLGIILDYLWDRDASIEITISKTATSESELTRLAITEGRELLKRKDFPWEGVNYASNCTITNIDEQKVRKWLTDILNLAEKSLQPSHD